MKGACLDASQSEAVRPFVKDAKSADKICAIRKEQTLKGRGTPLAKRRVDMQRDLDQLNEAA